jgi:hypothetical protein
MIEILVDGSKLLTVRRPERPWREVFRDAPPDAAPPTA